VALPLSAAMKPTALSDGAATDRAAPLSYWQILGQPPPPVRTTHVPDVLAALGLTGGRSRPLNPKAIGTTGGGSHSGGPPSQPQDKQHQDKGKRLHSATSFSRITAFPK
jgi:hypothetical protein